MKRIFPWLLGATLFAAEPRNTCCFFEEGCTNWYAGAGVSFADLFYYKNTQTNNTASNLFAANDRDEENTTSAPSLGYNVFLGYSYNDYIDLELKGVQIVRPFKNSYTSDFSATDDDDTYSGTTRLYVVTFGPYVILNLPLYQKLTPYFRFGMATDLVTFKDNATEVDAFDADDIITSGSQKEYLWAEKFNIGMGFKGSWCGVVTAKVEYEMPLSNTISGATTTRSGDDFYIPGILSASLAFDF